MDIINDYVNIKIQQPIPCILQNYSLHVSTGSSQFLYFVKMISLYIFLHCLMFWLFCTSAHNLFHNLTLSMWYKSCFWLWVCGRPWSLTYNSPPFPKTFSCMLYIDCQHIACCVLIGRIDCFYRIYRLFL
jgi:hypothetical protein